MNPLLIMLLRIAAQALIAQATKWGQPRGLAISRLLLADGRIEPEQLIQAVHRLGVPGVQVAWDDYARSFILSALPEDRIPTTLMSGEGLQTFPVNDEGLSGLAPADEPTPALSLSGATLEDVIVEATLAEPIPVAAVGDDEPTPAPRSHHRRTKKDST